MNNQKDMKLDAAAFGLSNEEAEKVKDITPSYKLSDLKKGQTAHFKLVEKMPRSIEYEDKSVNPPKKEKRQVIQAVDLDSGLDVTLWLSAKSLQMEFYKLAKRHNGDLEGVHIKIGIRIYEHDKWGATTKAYVVQEDNTAEEILEE